AAPQAHRRRSVHVKLVRRVWKNHRANVSSFNDQIIFTSQFVELLRHDLPHQRKAADPGNAAVNLIVPEMFGRIRTIHESARLVLAEAADNGDRLKRAGDLPEIVWINLSLQNVPRDGAINAA